MKIYFDTAVIVASAIEDHPHHPQAAAALRDVHEKRTGGCLSTHAIAEAYAVLTRTPFQPPVYPSEAWQILTANVLPHFQIVGLSWKEYKQSIQTCVDRGWSGGRVYDALHIRAARKAACDQIYTFNVRHFRELAPEWAERIRVP